MSDITRPITAVALKAFISIDSKFEDSFQKRCSARNRAEATVSSWHEMYFDGLALQAPDPSADLRQAIEKRFDSLGKWTADFIASAKAAAGSAMLLVHPVNGRLYNVVSDEHDQGPMWLAMPRVVIDVYEYAFD